MYDAKVDEYRTDMEGIKVKGKNVPKPRKNWLQCGVSSKILKLLKKSTSPPLSRPRPIQCGRVART